MTFWPRWLACSLAPWLWTACRPCTWTACPRQQAASCRCERGGGGCAGRLATTAADALPRYTPTRVRTCTHHTACTDAHTHTHPRPRSLQVRECASALLSVAKAARLPVFLVGHVTKSGDLAGPRVLEHIVDAVLHMEGARGHPVRLVSAPGGGGRAQQQHSLKNRHLAALLVVLSCFCCPALPCCFALLPCPALPCWVAALPAQHGEPPPLPRSPPTLPAMLCSCAA
jgi:hypothetical protein